ncbi:MAG: RHS repeat-associated core domain-containing protein [Anaerolineales bacterium]
MPFGQVRPINSSQITQTDFGFTGQRNNSYIELIDFKARWLDSELQRFISPDDIVPDLNNPQSLNRYSYVNNSPINHNDPSGHCNATPAFVGDANFVWSCIQDIAAAVSSYQSGNRNPIGLAATASGVTRLAREAGDAVNQWNADTATVLSNAPVSQRLPAAARISITGTLIAASIVGGPEGAEAASEEEGGVYTLRDPETGEVQYVGRTNDLLRRQGEHALDPTKGQLDFNIEARTDDYEVQRGLEQMKYDQYDPPLNRIRPISPNNPNIDNYLDAAERFIHNNY